MVGIVPLPLRRGKLFAHDYVRHGTTSLFAALDARTGAVWNAGLGCSPKSSCAVECSGELEAAIYRYLDVTNEDPKPFVWTKTADQILASVARFCRRTLDTGH